MLDPLPNNPHPPTHAPTMDFRETLLAELDRDAGTRIRMACCVLHFQAGQTIKMPTAAGEASKPLVAQTVKRYQTARPKRTTFNSWICSFSWSVSQSVNSFTTAFA